MTRALSHFIAALVVAVSVTAALVVPAQADDCLGRRQIQQKIDAGEVVQVSEAMARAGVKGKLISSAVELCQINGTWQWRATVMDAYGESRVVTLPAQ